MTRIMALIVLGLIFIVACATGGAMEQTEQTVNHWVALWFAILGSFCTLVWKEVQE